MAISQDIQSLDPTALLELFILDTTILVGGSLYYFHAGTNGLNAPVIWQGETYVPLPIEASGFNITVRGAPPRPHIKVANIDGMFSGLVAANDDLIGCKITRKRTFAQYLDAGNFPSNSDTFQNSTFGLISPTPDPTQYLPDDVWFIDRKVSENRFVVQWELASAFDLQNVFLPYRQVIQNSCPWQYRGPECGWTGTTYYDLNDQPCTQANDYCAKRLSSCKVRWGTAAYPYGGFPGAQQYA
ncbi:phage minor tail protein L [Ferrovum sp.]|uniref:phage minor tail protein L n=1 Tax=Ferrovum sp. TaxID=2609467 RepID=UPI00260F9234|nr:phage minor tail protein L [Ferrovum sp.]